MALPPRSWEAVRCDFLIDPEAFHMYPQQTVRMWRRLYVTIAVMQPTKKSLQASSPVLDKWDIATTLKGNDR